MATVSRSPPVARAASAAAFIAAKLPENPWATAWSPRLIGSEARSNRRDISSHRVAAANVSAA